MQPWRRPSRSAPYQPKAPKRIPRAIPDERFNELFAALPSHRDRALLAFWISTGARASELLTVTQGHVEPADQRIGVIRKGSRALQTLPASLSARNGGDSSRSSKSLRDCSVCHHVVGGVRGR
jgi:site-specific recombinase XerC